MVICLPEFEYFTVFLKNRKFISKIRRSKVTDYAALRCTTKLGDSDCEFGTEFKLSVDLTLCTVTEGNNGFGIYLTSQS